VRRLVIHHPNGLGDVARPVLARTVGQVSAVGVRLGQQQATQQHPFHMRDHPGMVEQAARRVESARHEDRRSAP
jgi:hypothetical protein